MQYGDGILKEKYQHSYGELVHLLVTKHKLIYRGLRKQALG